MKNLVLAVALPVMVGCATLTSDAMTPVALSFSDGSQGKCQLANKRGVWSTEVPITIPVRRSDDALKYDCTTEHGAEAVGQIESTVGAKIVASAVFIDLGITDAITDKHREYPASFVIPVAGTVSTTSKTAAPDEQPTDVYSDIERLSDLRDRGILTEEEFEAEKKKLLDRD